MKVTDHRNEGRQLLQSGDVEGALVVYLEGASITEDEEERSIFLANAAACILKDSEAREERLVECIQYTSEILQTNSSHVKARWRRGKANRRLGHEDLHGIDIEILRTIHPNNKEVIEEVEQISTTDSVHKAILSADNISSLEKSMAVVTVSDFDLFFEHGGELSLVYLVTSPCLLPAMKALAVLKRSFSINIEAIINMESLVSLLQMALDHQSGRQVRTYAAAIIETAFEAVGQNSELSRDYLDYLINNTWDYVCRLLSTGKAIEGGMRVVTALIRTACYKEDKQRFAPFIEKICIAANALWKSPFRAAQFSELIASLQPDDWELMVNGVSCLKLLEVMKSTLIDLTRYSNAAASSDAATVVGVIAEVLHPEDHCLFQDPVPPVNPLPTCCAFPPCSKPESEVEFQLCGSCRLTTYCSAECAAEDWRQHGLYCGPEPTDAEDKERAAKMKYQPVHS